MATPPQTLVIFNPDQWRGDVLGHAGNAAAVTPNLDRLVAADAASFANAFCQNPVCTPSRCSFMTGWYPHVAGHRTMFHMLRPHEPVLLKELKDAGYFVWWGGKNDLVPAQNSLAPYCDVYYDGHDRAWDNWQNSAQDRWRGRPGSDDYYSFHAGALDARGEPFYHDDDWACVTAAVELIHRRPTDKPMCIYLPLGYPHPPYGVEERFLKMIDPARLPPRVPTVTDWAGRPAMLGGIAERQNLAGWPEDRWTRLRTIYYAMCARSDAMLGLVLDALRETGLYDDAALFCFSDHGDFTGDYGLVEKNQNTFQDCLTRVPLIIKPPAGVPVAAGLRDGAGSLVELVDFAPTVYELAGITPRYSHFGRSLLPMVGCPGRAGAAGRDAVFCEGGRLRGERHCMELGSSSSSDPAGLYWPRLSLQRSSGPEHGKAVMCRTQDFKYVRRLYESDELYDLRSDPAELVNRIDDPSLAEVRTRLRDRLLTFFLETADVVPHDPDARW